MFEEFIMNPGFQSFAEVMGSFIIVFTIVYAIFTKIRYFDNNRFNTMVALVMGFAFIFPHYTGIGPDYVPAINILIPSVVLILLALLSFFIITSVIGIELNKQTFATLWIALVIFDLMIPDVLMIAWLANTFGWTLPSWLSFLQEKWFIDTAIMIIVVGGIIFFIAKEDKKDYF